MTRARKGERRNQNQRQRDEGGLAEKTGKAEDGTRTGLEGQDRASATTFLETGTWTMLLVKSEIKAKG